MFIACRANSSNSSRRSRCDRISSFTHPFLILHGTNDVCTSFPHAKNFYETAASDDKTFQPVDGAYHLLSHGPERKYVAKAAGEWIAARL